MVNLACKDGSSSLVSLTIFFLFSANFRMQGSVNDNCRGTRGTFEKPSGSDMDGGRALCSHFWGCFIICIAEVMLISFESLTNFECPIIFFTRH